MYEAHFGLKSSPFGSTVEGAGVFVGPQQAKIMKSLHKGLGAQDAVVTVTGPVGVGKTTIVSRALETISPGRMVAWVGRMQLAPDEVVDLLLAGFGIRKQSKGTIQRFAGFRRLLGERAATGIPVAIVVEDAHRIGPEALVEIETLTAADTGDSAGANIILMGQPGLHDLLSEPDLARMKQRIRLRQKVSALSLAEVSGYLKHCIRDAGGDYDAIFDPGVADIVFGCSEGIPRVINTLCATALTTAAEEDVSRVSAALMHEVAADAFGYDGPIPETPEASTAAPVEEKAAVVVPVETAPAAKVTPEPQDEPEIDWEKPPVVAAEDLAEDDLPRAARNVVVESGCYPEKSTAVQDVPPEPIVADVAETAQDIDDIPDLINDTQPELSTLEISDEAIEPKPVPDLVTEESEDDTSGDTAILKGLPETAALNADETSDGTTDDNDNFDLDAALSVETDDTNVMEGITPNLDKLASEAKAADQASAKNDAAVAEKAVAEKAAAEKLAVEKAVAEKLAVEKAVAEKLAAEKAVAEKLAAEKAAAEKAAAEKAAAEKAAAEKAAAEKAAAEKAAADKAAAEKAAAEKAATEKAAAENAAAEKAAAEENELPSLDELPTLSDSMRVDVDKEVDRAKQAEGRTTPAEDAIAKPKQPSSQNISEMTARIAAINPDERSGEVDALEAALEAAKKGDFASIKPAHPTPAAASANIDEVPTEIPEITLDKELPDRPLDDQELLKAAEEIGSANTLEDISDDMAETLFGSQAFNKIAAAVVANPPKDHEMADAPPAGPSPVKIDDAAGLKAANDAIEPPLELEIAVEAATKPPANEPEIAVEAGTETGSPEIDPGEAALKESVAMRIDMLNAMKSKVDDSPAEVVELGEEAPKNTRPKPSGPQPESIENQIDTSITRTLEALDVTKVTEEIAADESQKKPKKSGGLFSRFRKSS